MHNRGGTRDAVTEDIHIAGQRGQWDGEDAHEGAVAELAISSSNLCRAVLFYHSKHLAGGAADVEERPMGRPQSMRVPANEALAHVLSVEAFLSQTFDCAEQQRAIVGPSSLGLSMRAVVLDVRHRVLNAIHTRSELNWHTESIANERAIEAAEDGFLEAMELGEGKFRREKLD